MVKNRVISCVAAMVGIKEIDISVDNTLEDRLGMDSLDKVELIMAIEDEFDVMIDDDEVDRCKTVADVVAVVEQALAVKREARAALGGAA